MKLSEKIENKLARLDDLNDEYRLDDVADDEELTEDEKLKVVYEFNRYSEYGHGAVWTEAIERVLDVLDLEVDGINDRK